MPKKVLVIQARIGSTRLPAKVLLPLAGKPLISRLVERVLDCKTVDEVVVAIPENYENDILNKVLLSSGAEIYRGSENDVLDRYYQASRKYNADYILRIPADNPVPCSEEIDRVVNFHLKNNCFGFSSNLAEVHNSRYPDGIGAEIFSFDNLASAWENRKAGSESSEHVHLNFYDYKKKMKNTNFKFDIDSPLCPESFARPDVILDVNTLAQYLFIAEMYEDLYDAQMHFKIEQIVKWYDWKTEKNND